MYSKHFRLISGDTVQKKWKYLRDYFRSECAKIPKLKSGDKGGTKVFKSNWPHYEAMKFLLNQMSNRSSSGNLSAAPRSLNCSQASSDGDFSVVVEPLDQQLENSLPEDVGEIFENQEELAETCVDEPRFSIPSRKRKNRNEAIGNALIEVEKEKLSFLKARQHETSLKTSGSGTNEDINFFYSLLPHVKLIKQECKLMFRNEIQQLVQRYAYGEQQPLEVVIPASKSSSELRSTPRYSPGSSYSSYSPTVSSGPVLEMTSRTAHKSDEGLADLFQDEPTFTNL